MKKKNILKKVLLSLTGSFVLFLLIEMIFDWSGFVESIKEGYNDANKENVEMTK